MNAIHTIFLNKEKIISFELGRYKIYNHILAKKNKKMGGDQSTPSPQKIRTYGSSKLISPKDFIEQTPKPGARTYFDKHNQKISTIYDSSSHLIRENSREFGIIQNQPFSGIWSHVTFKGSKQPQQRIWACSAYSDEYDVLVVAYGKSTADDSLFFNDCWVLDFNQGAWKCLSEKVKSPRIGARAVIVGTRMFIFGGMFNGKYLADLHSIDILTGEVDILKTTGHAPKPRTTPVVTAYDGKLLVWGGYDECEDHSTLHSMDIQTNVWQRNKSLVAGRMNASFAQIDCVTNSHTSDNLINLDTNSKCYSKKLFIFGSAKRQGLLQVNMDSSLFEEVFTTGNEPPASENGTVMIPVEKYLIVFGGASQQYTHVYAYDPDRKWWFVFTVEPDRKTVHEKDGRVLKNRLFMLPGEESPAACYRSKTREIYYCFGSTRKTRNKVSRISIGEALSILKLREDMLDALILPFDRKE